MTNRHAVIWFNAKGDEYRGSAPTYADAIHLLMSAQPRDAVRGIVKLGRRIVHREDLSCFSDKALAAA